MASPHYCWFLRTLIHLCPEFSKSHQIDQLVAESSDPKEALSSFLKSPEPYAHLCSILFKSNPTDNVIQTLQKNNYFDHIPLNFFDTMKGFQPEKIGMLIECLMWAYLDVMNPIEAFERVIGKVKTSSCSDAESRICRWINTIVRKHAQLTPVSTISHHFLGLPNLRIVIYNFLLDPSIYKLDDSPDGNAKVIIEQLTNLNVPPPFTEYKQPPLVLMCYMFEVVKRLSEIKPVHKTRCISSQDVSHVIMTIHEKKEEVRQLTKKVDILQHQVIEITQKLESMKRPVSVIQHHHNRVEGSDGNSGRPQTSLANPEKRVKWDISPQDMLSGRPQSKLDRPSDGLVVDTTTE